MNKAKLPTHVKLKGNKYGLPKNSVALMEQLRTIDKTRLREKIGTFSADIMNKIDEAIGISLAIEQD